MSASEDVERVAALDDPAARARAATDALGEHQEAVAELARIRRAAVAELRASGLSYAQVGETLGITRGRVAQLGVDYGRERGFFGGDAVRIAIPLRATRLPEERLVIAQEDQETATVLTRLLRRMDLEVTHDHVPPTGEVDFGPEALVLVCGPKSSSIVFDLLGSGDPALEFAPDRLGRWRLVDRATGQEFVSPRDQDPAEPGDYAYLGRVPRPDGRPFLLIAGVHAVGSLGAAHYVSSGAHLAQLYGDVAMGCFSMVIGSTFEGSPPVITSSRAVIPPRRH